MIDFGVIIPNYIECIPNTMYVEKIEYGERKTKGGLYIQAEQMDYEGRVAHPRWAKVRYKADNIKNIEVGDWVLLEHGHWSTSMKMFINNKEETLWFISPKSFKEGVMALSKTMPKQLEEYGIEDNE